MKIYCTNTLDDFNPELPAVIVLPEGIPSTVMLDASLLHHDAYYVGAFPENGYCRGAIYYQGINKIEYLKVECDQRSKGSGNTEQCPIFESEDICIAVLVCMDIDHVEFSLKIREKLKQSKAKIKILCIPADMHNEWFPSEELPAKYNDIYTALSNNNLTYQDPCRCRSFIANPEGLKLVKQQELQPIHIKLPK